MNRDQKARKCMGNSSTVSGAMGHRLGWMFNCCSYYYILTSFSGQKWVADEFCHFSICERESWDYGNGGYNRRICFR